MFTNPEIPLAELPGADGIDWQPLHPSFVRRVQAARFLRNLGWAAALGFLHLLLQEFVPPTGYEFMLFVALWTLLGLETARSLIWPGVEVPRRGYALREHDMLYRRGVLWRSVLAVPMNRVQHAEIQSTPLDRHFGTATLTLATAGSGGISIEGLDAARADVLRSHVARKLASEEP